jgi:Flp pilus assembly pilin Flp
MSGMFLQVALLLRRLRANRAAVTSLEYGLLSSMVAVTILSSISSLGNHLSTVFNTIATHL